MFSPGLGRRIRADTEHRCGAPQDRRERMTSTWMSIEAAVGEREGRAVLHFSAKSDASNSLVLDSRRAMAHRGDNDHTRRLTSACTRSDPNMMKIDVETFEPAVLAGAAAMIERSRPYIVIEVLNRHGRDHGDEIARAMAPRGYAYYPLGAVPDWQQPRMSIEGAIGTPAPRLAVGPRTAG